MFIKKRERKEKLNEREKKLVEKKTLKILTKLHKTN